MTNLNYQDRAELYLGRDWDAATAQGPRDFRVAAHALRFAFEEAAPVSLRGARLRVGSHLFSGPDLERLYRSADYPLERKRQSRAAQTSSPRASKESLKVSNAPISLI